MSAGSRSQPWQRALQRFVREWRSRQQPLPSGSHRRVEMARTFLHITRTPNTHEAFNGLGTKQVLVTVENRGNVAAYTCVVRSFEGRPRSPIEEKIPLAEFTLRGQVLLTLQPGELRTIRVPFEQRRVRGTYIAIVSDPLLDPNELTVADWTHRRVLLVNIVS